MLTRRRTITVGAVQARSEPGEVEVNLAHATPFVERAAAQGADLVVLPELFSCGYVPNRAVWDSAEPADGPTGAWLASTARRLGIFLGAGSVETDGTDFFNVFILADPGGRIAGRAYKANAEADVFRRGRHEHVIDTELGRIGVGICADNQFVAHLRLMRQQQVELILMPHAWPTPARAAGLVSEADVRLQWERVGDLPRLYARLLGVPVVFVNQVGPLLPIGGILGRLMDPRIWRLRGQSMIVDSNGSVAGQLSEEEEALVATVSMDPARGRFEEPRSFSGWLQPGSPLARRVLIPLDIATGRLSYALSRDRAARARAASAGSAFRGLQRWTARVGEGVRHCSFDATRHTIAPGGEPHGTEEAEADGIRREVLGPRREGRRPALEGVEEAGEPPGQGR